MRIKKGIDPSLLQIGNIKIGMKGEMRKSKGGKEFQLPEKINHFLITGMTRDKNNNYVINQSMTDAMKAHERAKVNSKGQLVSIPVRLLFDNPEHNFPTRYSRYTGTDCVCFR